MHDNRSFPILGVLVLPIMKMEKVSYSFHLHFFSIGSRSLITNFLELETYFEFKITMASAISRKIGLMLSQFGAVLHSYMSRLSKGHPLLSKANLKIFISCLDT